MSALDTLPPKKCRKPVKKRKVTKIAKALTGNLFNYHFLGLIQTEVFFFEDYPLISTHFNHSEVTELWKPEE